VIDYYFLARLTSLLAIMELRDETTS
jgi:hypothetical protein